jgi:hypothetical protein
MANDHEEKLMTGPRAIGVGAIFALMLEMAITLFFLGGSVWCIYGWVNFFRR